jgi:glucans biosynthesis protein C
MSPPATRRHDLDALRVAAFLLLILYHLGMFYVPWDWHVKSQASVPGLEPWMQALNPWRLTLLFVISGAATRFMAERLSAGALARQRSVRLLIPLAVGMWVIVPPQSWAEVVAKAGYTGSYLDFLPHYFSFDQSFGIILPTYNHLWFVAYLWVYTLAAAALAPAWTNLDRWGGRLLAGPLLLIVPILVFALLRATAHAAWGETHVIWADGYGHLKYGAAFAIGFWMARQDDAWAALKRWRVGLLGGAAALLALRLATGPASDLAPWTSALLREAYAWVVICALFGWAQVLVRKGSPALSTLSEAVFPAYIVHQTAIILAGVWLTPLALPAALEAGLVLAFTLASAAGAYGLARSVPALRLPLGLKPGARVRLAPARA